MHIHLIADATEIARRRRLLPTGTLVEAWADLAEPGLFWIGEGARQLLDSVGDPMVPRLSVARAWVRIHASATSG